MPLKRGECCADKLKEIPKAPLLLPWTKTWPFLHSVLGKSFIGKHIDIKKTVAKAVTCKPLYKIPKKSHHKWKQNTHIILDFNENAIPFQRDMSILCKKLIKMRGKFGLEIFITQNGPQGTFTTWNAPEKGEFSYSLPEEGTALLALGDLGYFSKR